MYHLFTNILSNHNAKNSPERFKRMYILLALTCLVLILVFSWLVITRHTRETIITDAVIDSTKVVSALQTSERDALQTHTHNGKNSLAISPGDLPAFDKRIRAFLHPLSIVKIKIYDNNMRIIYCTEKALTGKLDDSNQRLKNTLDGFTQTVMKDRQSITDLSEEKRFEVDVAEVYVPFKNQTGQVVGVFEVYTDVSNIKETFKQHTTSSMSILFLSLMFLSAISYFVINRISLSLSSAYNKLEIVAATDSLTGVLNRGELLVRAEGQYEMMRRSSNKFSDGVGIGVIMIDVDNFKCVNDSFGHLIGDDVLRILTEKVEATLRPYDIFGRYGGEEFLIFLPTTTIEESEMIANRILNEVSEHPFYVGDLAINMTVSIGCSWTNAQEENLDKVLSRVDAFMYKAKNNGRNQVVSGF